VIHTEHMLLRSLGLALCFSLVATAQPGITVEQVKQFVRSAKEKNQSDRDVAGALRALKLSERLDEHTIEDLRREGAGPKTVAALKELAAKSAELPPPQPAAPKKAYVPPPAPSSEDQGRIIAEVREKALTFTESLPDYICAQQTRRFIDPTGGESWHATDVILARLTYFQHKEDYKLVTVNNNVTTDKAYTSVGGAISQGEFGSMMRGLFDPASNASFQWGAWTTLRGHTSYVFSYAVPLEHSQFTIDWHGGASDQGRKIIAGYHGSIVVDKATEDVLRISLEADNIPPDFPVRQSSEVLEYDLIKIGDREFLLPVSAEFRSLAGHTSTRNLVEFRNYRKFFADTKLTFDDTDAQPANENKPNQPPPKP
jgi:hypothetical protein